MSATLNALPMVPVAQTSPSESVLKRVFDVCGALLIIAFVSPILLIIAALVAASKGPIVFGHTRIGKNGAPFKCLKFRTMVPDAEQRLKALLRDDPEFAAEWNIAFKSPRDPRITRVGKYLRKTSLDELPQLFNVLRGEMSLVGPRPVISDEIVRYRRGSRYYLSSRPGMTGLWQISGRNDVSYEARVAMDRYYVSNRSFRMDLRILFGTIRVVVRGSGAY
ncbi:MAG: sugar transferase [Pseudomonadota bacterium]